MKPLHTVLRGALAAICIAAPASAQTGWGSSMYQYSFAGAAYAPLSDCRASLTIADNVLLPGERTAVHAWGHFPLDGYALAACEFDVSADFPAWSFASDGAIVGAQVLGAQFSQPHQPFLGVFADPSNPLRMWTGMYEPDSYEPRLVTLTATPQSLSYYPSGLTISTAECEPDAGSARLLINPLRIGGVGFAPGAGTSMAVLRTRDGVELRNPRGLVEAGTALPHGVSVLAWARVDGVSPLDGESLGPDSLTFEGTTVAGGDRPTESISVNFTKVSFQYTPFDDQHRSAAPPAGWAMACRGRGFERAAYSLYLDSRLIGSFAAADGRGPISHAVPFCLKLEGVDGEATDERGPAIEARFKKSAIVVLPDGTAVEADRIVAQPIERSPDALLFNTGRIEIRGVQSAKLALEAAERRGGQINPVFADGSVRFISSW